MYTSESGTGTRRINVWEELERACLYRTEKVSWQKTKNVKINPSDEITIYVNEWKYEPRGAIEKHIYMYMIYII